MNREEIQAKIDKILSQIENVRRHLRESEYVWPKHLVGAKREIAALDERVRVLREQFDALEGDENDE
jgi:polyhydroxyalkanoate synthesis regulator phasin